MNNKDEEIEILSFDDDTPLSEKTEVLALSADIEVSNEIDEMLDFFDIEKKDNDEQKQNINIINEINNVEDNTKIELDSSKEKLEEYTPSIKDFNIKSARTRKIVHKAMLYVVIIMLLGFEFFINKTGDILNDLRVYASDFKPIRIVQNEKYGYIDSYGKKLVNPKYIYAEEFIGGYAIVKNSSNLPLIIDKGGKEVVSSGKYFSIYRAKEDIIVSKVEKEKLKYAILDKNLKNKTKFIYDLISYDGNIYTFTKDNTVGIINESGKEIYTYKLTDSDDKKIDVNIPEFTSDKFERYGVVTVNSSSQIINLNSGKEITKPTLNEIVAEENNVFYEKLPSGNKRYIYIQNNEVILESDNYVSLSISSLDSGVLKAVNSSYKYEYISVSTKEQLKKNLDEKNVYESDSYFIYKEHNYKNNKDEFVIIKDGEKYKTIEANFEIYKSFVNGIAIIKYDDETYGYLNNDGNIISDKHFLECMEFDIYNQAVAKLESGYGVINESGKVIIDFENENIIMSPGKVKKNSISYDNIFYAVLKNGKYNLYNSKGKKVSKTNYDEVSFDENYNIVKVSSDVNDSLIVAKTNAIIDLSSSNMEYKAYENYIIIKNRYYNYEGKMIYVDNSKERLNDE